MTVSGFEFSFSHHRFRLRLIEVCLSYAKENITRLTYPIKYTREKKQHRYISNQWIEWEKTRMLMRCRILVALIYLVIFIIFAFDLLLLSFFLIFIFDIEFGLQISFFFLPFYSRSKGKRSRWDVGREVKRERNRKQVRETVVQKEYLCL